MDISNLDTAKAANEGFELQLYDPGSLQNLGIFITVLGRDSAEFRRLHSEQNRKRVQKVSKGGFRTAFISLEEMEEDAVELLAACTKSWRDEGESLDAAILVGGEKLVCNLASARKLYNQYHWIKEQVDAAVSDRANFIKR